MIEYNDEWIIKTDNINLTDDAKTQEMTLYAFCMKGSSNLTYDGKDFELKPGMLLVANNCSVMSVGRQTDDFAVEGMFVHPKYHNLTALRSNYTLRHILLLNANPVMELLPKEQERWHRDYENVFYQLSVKENKFQHEMMIAVSWQLIIDCFDFTSRIYGKGDTSTQASTLANKFFEMLEQGDFREHRNIPHYAEKLFVTSKHLSEVIKKVSGHSANYWITHYTVAELQNTLRGTEKTMTQIAYEFNFSSVAYFTRYLQTNLGVTPTQLRE